MRTIRNERGVALLLTLLITLAIANLGWETCSPGYGAPPYEVDITRGSYSDHVWVGDVGPWNIDDNYWNPATNHDRPRRRDATMRG